MSTSGWLPGCAREHAVPRRHCADPRLLTERSRRNAETWFAASTGRWPEGPTSSLGLGSFIAFLGTTASMIAFINSVVAGAGVALLVDVLFGGVPVWVGLLCGLPAVAILMIAF